MVATPFLIGAFLGLVVYRSRQIFKFYGIGGGVLFSFWGLFPVLRFLCLLFGSFVLVAFAVVRVAVALCRWCPGGVPVFALLFLAWFLLLLPVWFGVGVGCLAWFVVC